MKARLEPSAEWQQGERLECVARLASHLEINAGKLSDKEQHATARMIRHLASAPAKALEARRAEIQALVNR